MSRSNLNSNVVSSTRLALPLTPPPPLQITAPDQHSGALLQSISKRRGVIKELDVKEGLCTVTARAPLQGMFGYTTELRSTTQGMGLFTMEFSSYEALEEEDQVSSSAKLLSLISFVLLHKVIIKGLRCSSAKLLSHVNLR